MFEPVDRNIYRWSMTDPEFGEQMNGHLLMKAGSIVLIDPPATESLVEYVKILGNPVAVIATIYNHRRGCYHVSEMLGVPLYIPGTTVRGEKMSEASLKKYDFPSGKVYNEETELPLGITAHRLLVEYPPGELALEEMELLFGDYLIVGDSSWGINGKLNIFPTGIFPDEGGNLSNATAVKLREIIRKTGARGLVSGHGGYIRDNLQSLI